MRTHTFHALRACLVALVTASLLLVSTVLPAASQDSNPPSVAFGDVTVSCVGGAYQVEAVVSTSDADGLDSILAAVFFEQSQPYYSSVYPFEGRTSQTLTFTSPLFSGPPVFLAVSVLDETGAQTVIESELTPTVCPAPQPVSYAPVMETPITPVSVSGASAEELFDLATSGRYDNTGDPAAVFGGGPVESGLVAAGGAGGGSAAIASPTVSSGGNAPGLAVTGSTTTTPLAGGVILVALGLIVMGLGVRNRTH